MMIDVAQAPLAHWKKKLKVQKHNPCFAYEQEKPLTNKFCFCFEAAINFWSIFANIDKNWSKID